jgi:hypothetical protein
MNGEVNFCSQCGEKVSSGAKFCSNCGHDLKNSSTKITLDKPIKAEVTNVTVEKGFKAIEKTGKPDLETPYMIDDGCPNCGTSITKEINFNNCWVIDISTCPRCKSPLPEKLKSILRDQHSQKPLDENMKVETGIDNPDHDPPSLDTDMPWELPTGMTDQLLENQKSEKEPEKKPQKTPQKTPPPIWVPITLVICFHIYGVLQSFNWDVKKAIFIIGEVPDVAIFDTLLYNLAFSIGLIHLIISQFFKSKRNSYTRRYIVIFWTMVSFVIFLPSLLSKLGVM